MNSDKDIPKGLPEWIRPLLGDTSEIQLTDADLAEAARIIRDGARAYRESMVPFVVKLPRPKTQLSWAAAGDSPDRKLAFHSWKIEGSDVLVHLNELLGVPNGFTLSVERDASGMLEGAVIFDAETSRLGLIEGGSAGSTESPLRFPTSSLRIELSDGQSVRLLPTNK
jgi:hypothetical protein